jgi:uncharacterized cupredoxin-like copper-binding protein
LTATVFCTFGLAITACTAPTPEVTVVLTDHAFEPQTVAIQRAQKTILKLQNKGAVEHNLFVQRQNITSPTVKPGETATFEIALPPGDFPIVCNLPGHEELGMVGKLSSIRKS